jgi:hypothetical protein
MFQENRKLFPVYKFVRGQGNVGYSISWNAITTCVSCEESYSSFAGLLSITYVQVKSINTLLR